MVGAPCESMFYLLTYYSVW